MKGGRACYVRRVEISVIFESLRINLWPWPVDLDKRGITLNLRLSKLSWSPPWNTSTVPFFMCCKSSALQSRFQTAVNMFTNVRLFALCARYYLPDLVFSTSLDGQRQLGNCPQKSFSIGAYAHCLGNSFANTFRGLPRCARHSRHVGRIA